jgi:hypothetical protein
MRWNHVSALIPSRDLVRGLSQASIVCPLPTPPPQLRKRVGRGSEKGMDAGTSPAPTKDGWFDMTRTRFRGDPTHIRRDTNCDAPLSALERDHDPHDLEELSR